MQIKMKCIHLLSLFKNVLKNASIGFKICIRPNIIIFFALMNVSSRASSICYNPSNPNWVNISIFSVSFAAIQCSFSMKTFSCLIINARCRWLYIDFIIFLFLVSSIDGIINAVWIPFSFYNVKSTTLGTSWGCWGSEPSTG